MSIGVIIGSLIWKLMGYSSEFDTIQCSVDINPTKPDWLLDRVKLQVDLTKIAADIIRSYGIKAEELPPASLGGGGLSTFIQLIEDAWAHKDLIAFAVTAISSTKRVFMLAAKKSLAKHKPRYYVYLSISSNEPEDLDNRLVLSARVKLLKSLADAICEKLRQDYPVLLYDQSLSIRYRPTSFSANFKIKHENQSGFNAWRFSRVASALSISPSRYLNFDFGRVFIRVSKSEAKAQGTQGWSRSAKTQKSYLFLSGKA